jgi:hypothetical protein
MVAGRMSAGVGTGVAAAVVTSASCRFSDGLFAETSFASLVLSCALPGVGALRPRCEMERPIFLKKSPTGFAATSAATGIIGADVKIEFYVRLRKGG